MQISELSRDECFAALAQAKLGRLGCARRDQPYVVPIYFAFGKSTSGEQCLYGFTTPGQKVEWMRDNPLVCVEWDEITSFDRWISIIVLGHYEEIPDQNEAGQGARMPTRASSPDRFANSQELQHAHDLLQERAHWWEPGYAAYLARPAAGERGDYQIIYYRILIDQITGHRALPKPDVALENP